MRRSDTVAAVGVLCEESRAANRLREHRGRAERGITEYTPELPAIALRCPVGLDASKYQALIHKSKGRVTRIDYPDWSKVAGEGIAFAIVKASEGKSYVTVAIGCTGGKHRSVAIAEELKRRMSSVGGIRLRVRHRDIAQE